MRYHAVVGTLLTAAATLLLMGCSSSRSGAPQQNPVTGQHPANWTQNHPKAYLLDPDSCTTCHGSTTDAAAAGGTSKVSCFGCHHPSGPNHPANWSDHMQHGRNGAQLAANTAAYSMQGFASCQVCHGADYTTGIGTTKSCFSCHTKGAPHPDAPWGATNPPANPATSSSHDQTAVSNAATCYVCHAANSTINLKLNLGLANPAASTTAPGCFNSTMCHGSTGLTPDA